MRQISWNDLFGGIFHTPYELINYLTCVRIEKHKHLLNIDRAYLIERMQMWLFDEFDDDGTDIDWDYLCQDLLLEMQDFIKLNYLHRNYSEYPRVREYMNYMDKLCDE